MPLKIQAQLELLELPRQLPRLERLLRLVLETQTQVARVELKLLAEEVLVLVQEPRVERDAREERSASSSREQMEV